MEPLKKPRRHNTLRLPNYDYSQNGSYFVTICAYNRECLFGEIQDNRMILNQSGRILDDVWNDLPKHYYHVLLEAFIIMPNHVHGIVTLRDPIVGAGLKPAPTMGIGRIYNPPLRQHEFF